MRIPITNEECEIKELLKNKLVNKMLMHNYTMGILHTIFWGIITGIICTEILWHISH
jgi:hypothetical protein